ncbi:Hint domain-containing protein [Phaeobacter sp. B1627]|uniref:Hint domain-containing protein n=1 Tax=Phaeobacter sp. B1627 TaxID=2583809 RepID=UPI001119602E|nr:Hint domain-containing protein [Phaeobacter sp. B1627]TNJ41561.1 Hint domain-containing protein [Phaeobacter sp. B1627]
MPTVTLELRGDQIGRYTRVSGYGNGSNRVVIVNGVEAIGSASDIYTVVVEQVRAGGTEFENGQFVTIYDSTGAVVVPRSGVQPDIQQGRGDGDEHLILYNQPFLIDLGGVPDGPARVRYTRADEAAGPGGDDDGHLDFDDFPCFATGTLITTPSGQVDVADLKVGDLVQTIDNGAVPLLWVGRRTLDLTVRGAAKPLLLRAGFSGAKTPHRDTVLSPDHRILVAGPACDLLFGTREVLAPAKGLIALARIREMQGRKSVEYVSLLTGRHQVILANGLPVETLYPGPEALHRLGAAGRCEVMALCPGLRTKELSLAYPAARRLLSKKEAQALSVVLRLTRRLNDASLDPQGHTPLRLVG